MWTTHPGIDRLEIILKSIIQSVGIASGTKARSGIQITLSSAPNWGAMSAAAMAVVRSQADRAWAVAEDSGVWKC